MVSSPAVSPAAPSSTLRFAGTQRPAGLNFSECRVFQRQNRPPISCSKGTDGGWGEWARGGRRANRVGFLSVAFVTINPLAPASIFWNNRLLRSERAVNRLDRKL